MKQKLVVLAILADPKTGGWPTYTAHLAYGIRAAGYEPLIVKLTKTSEKKPRDFGRGLSYWNMSPSDLATACHNLPTIITAVGKNKRQIAAQLLANGASVVIHDPTELDAQMVSVLSSAKVITIRQIISDRLAAKGVKNTFIPHPYKRSPVHTSRSRHNPVAISRVDFDKNTHIIIEANQKLSGVNTVVIHGTLNTLYDSVRLREVDADWKRNYAGGWSHKEDLWYPVELASQAKAVVDLSTINGDGGGTQYSFLEAIDSMTPLIIHKNWITGDKNYDEMARVVSQTITTSDDLVEVVENLKPANQEAYLSLLEFHEAKRIAGVVLENLNNG